MKLVSILFWTFGCFFAGQCQAPSLAPARPAPVQPALAPTDAPAGKPQPAPPVPGNHLEPVREQPAQADPSSPAPVTPKPTVLASDLFSSTLATIRSTEVRMGDEYVIGCGDQLAINAFGSVSLSGLLTVDRGGRISVPEVGLVAVDGLTVAGARAAVRAALQRKHAGMEQFSLEVVGLHDVEVSVLGEVARPGTFLVPSSSSPVAVLGLAGGPGESGSYRAIQQIRAGKVIRHLDLYRVRFEGLGFEAPGFEDGDVLFVPLAKVRIQAVGAFRRVAALAARNPAGVVLELLPGEGALEALEYVGGLVASASRVFLTVQRTSPAGLTSIHNIRNLKADLKAAQLCEADVLRALPRMEREEAFVEAAGFVAVPGRFAYRPGMRIKDLLTMDGQGDQLLPGTYRLRGEILRTQPDGRTQLLRFNVARALEGDPGQNLELQPRDRVDLGNVADLRLPRRVTLLGPFTRPGVFDWHEGMRASDLLYRAGIPMLSADHHYAELAHLREGSSSEVIRLDLARLTSTESQAPLALEDDASNPRLQPYDQITIYENPGYRAHRTVTITGQVHRPGPYVIQDDRFTLRQLIQRAGGLTPEAMPAAGIFLRSVQATRDPAAAQGPEPAKPLAADRDINDILHRLNETLRNKDTGALLANPLLHGLLQGTLNRMVVDFPAVLEGDDRQDVALQDGDQIVIPRSMDSVYVVGEVASPFASFHVKPGDRVADVLKLAGGYTRNADRGEVRLLRAGGRIIDSQVERTALEPGDTLLVPQRFRKDVTWQDTLLALTPIALLYNAIRH
jgi:protein involved in polysaccharide export with SLBB domain